MFNRRSILLSACALLVAVGLLGLQACTQAESKNSLNVGMVLEPPGLDPTVNAASAVGEVVLYNVFETLTQIQSDGTVQPLLAEADALPLGTVQAIGSLLSSIPREHAPEVMAWLDNAIARQADSARVAKASYMMSAPENYAAEDVFALIDRIGGRVPPAAKKVEVEPKAALAEVM